MSLFTNMSVWETRPMLESTILGVTGQSREMLTAMFRRNGLFGPDSAPSSAEQQAVLACLCRPGLPSSGVMPEMTAPLEVLGHTTKLMMHTASTASTGAAPQLAPRRLR